ncbi:MAG: 5-formaminoimidazole-4-carboxamide-(beta)-D-ribofuranosyl 5-monophosphate synthetase [Thermoproteota archaeon]|nr:5-formaminoimidazole-4-carboxamide-(beta)-D-ribofuranosyl 5-monophosphate synthetase [Thermoproteota archaeon]
MISKKDIDETLSRYDLKKIKIATICSHSALQIFHGARQEGFKTLGICLKARKFVYDAFPLAKPDEFLLVDDFKEILREDTQNELIENNVIVVAHGSFVEYIGSDALRRSFRVPMFGNRSTLEWESDRAKQRKWLVEAGLRLPREYKNPSEIDGRVFVKLPGAKGGRGFFTATSETEYYAKLEERIQRGVVSEADGRKTMIQEFIAGVRYYPHYFYSLTEDFGMKIRGGSLELLSMDKRIEPIDESYRGLPDVPEEFYDYTVTGNQPIILRESLLPEVFEMGAKAVDTSINLFPPGMLGAFSLETIFQPGKGFTVFEVSARIVAGTNVYPMGSPYSAYLFKEPMSSGRRISREVKEAVRREILDKIIY